MDSLVVDFCSICVFKLNLPRAPRPSIFFLAKSVVLHLQVGRAADRIVKREKSPATSGMGTHDISVIRGVLYRCASTAAPTHELLINLDLFIS